MSFGRARARETGAMISRIILDCAQPAFLCGRQIEVEASAYECVVQVSGHRVMRVSLPTPPPLDGIACFSVALACFSVA